ncbi:MAG: cyclic nucleotide-binding and patatin-like phospholipase domain-containing protein [Parachlamydiaceae bacterium]
MIERDISMVETEEMLVFLRALDFFSHLEEKELNFLLRLMKLVNVEGKETIIEEGEECNDVFIVVLGKLEVFKFDPSEKKSRCIGEIADREVVGEIASLTQLPRTATVKAARDSLLLKINHQNFNLFQHEHPAASLEIAKVALKRVVEARRALVPGEKIRTLVVAPASETEHHRFCIELAKEFTLYGKTVHVTSALCCQSLGYEIQEMMMSHVDFSTLTGWLQKLEKEHQYLVMETDKNLTPWSMFCLRSADHVLFAGDECLLPTLNQIEQFYFSGKRTDSRNLNDLIFIHYKGKTPSFKASEWLKIRPVDGYYHVNVDGNRAMKKIVRILTNHSFGVVLNGGGARGLSHIGVLKSLEEIGVEIDFIGGSSMGAVVAACYDIYGVEGSCIQTQYVVDHLLKDYTFPYLSFLKGKSACECLEHLGADLDIEDLNIPFFCVSCNLTEGQIKIHDKGKVWSAMRKTVSLPAVFPPLYDEEGRAFIDGGIINNLPVDVMRGKIRGGKILAVNCCSETPKSVFKSYPEAWKSGWDILKDKFLTFQHSRNDYDNIINLLYSSMVMASASQQNIMCKAADYLVKIDTSAYDLLDFKCHKEIIQLGYDQGKKQLEKLFGDAFIDAK